MRPLALSILTALATLSWSSLGVAQPRSLSRPLSTAERAILERGETVLRPYTERRGSLELFGGTSYQVIDLQPAECWAALHDDASRIRHMLPQVQRATELAVRGNHRSMRFEHRAGPATPSYTVDFEYRDDQRILVFRLDESAENDIDVAWGFFKLRSWEGGRTLVSFGVMADIGDGFISDALRPTVHEWILKIPLTFRRYLHRHRERYQRLAAR